MNPRQQENRARRDAFVLFSNKRISRRALGILLSGRGRVWGGVVQEFGRTWDRNFDWLHVETVSPKENNY